MISFRKITFRLQWTTSFKNVFVSVMNLSLICLFACMKLEKEHKKFLGCSFKIMLHYDILRNRLKYYMEWFIK